jgi:hypothetical protein
MDDRRVENKNFKFVYSIVIEKKILKVTEISIKSGIICWYYHNTKILQRIFMVTCAVEYDAPVVTIYCRVVPFFYLVVYSFISKCH